MHYAFYKMCQGKKCYSKNCVFIKCDKKCPLSKFVRKLAFIYNEGSALLFNAVIKLNGLTPLS